MKIPPGYKQYFLVAGSIILLIIGYQLAFKQTFEAWETHSQLQKKLASATDISTQPAYLNRKNHNLDQIIQQYTQDTVSFKNGVLNTIAELADLQQVKLTIIPTDDVWFHTPHLLLQKLNLEGSFFNLLKLTYTLHRTKSIGILRSATWKIKKISDEDSKFQVLDLELYMEIYKK